MIDNADYTSAFRLMNYILIGNIDMDDSDSSSRILDYRIYQFCLEFKQLKI